MHGTLPDGYNVNIARKLTLSTSKSKDASRSAESAAKGAYHHGSLRESLVEAGLAILAESGDPSALSLREAARRAGVSAMAPYRHFPDKEALLAAVASVGFDRLAARLRAADASPDGAAALVAQGCAYVAFACDETALFRLMFGGRVPKPADDYPLSNSAFAVLYDRVATLVPPADRERATLHCWALAHGLAGLAIDGLVARDGIAALAPAILSVSIAALPRIDPNFTA